MGIYIYGIKKKTRQHPILGEVGVLHFLHKPAPYDADKKWISANKRRENRYIDYWSGHDIPKVVCPEGDKDFENLYWYSGGPIWGDCDEEVCVPFKSEKGQEMLSAFFKSIV